MSDLNMLQFFLSDTKSGRDRFKCPISTCHNFFLSDTKSAVGENLLAAARDGRLLFLTALHCSCV